MDALLAAIDVAVVVAGLGSAAALKMSPNVAKWGFNKIIGWFR